MFTPASGMAPPRTHRAPGAPRVGYFGTFVCKRTFRWLFAIECDAQIMRRDRGIVNEMEFRMLRARQGLSPRSHYATMKRFSQIYRRGRAKRRRERTKHAARLHGN
jgi:hypothetical protein